MNNRNAYFLAFAATSGYVPFGWNIGLMDGVLSSPSFQAYFRLPAQSAPAYTSFSRDIFSSFQAGGFFGALLSCYFSACFGRKPVLLVSAIIFLVGSILQSTAGIGTSPDAGLIVLYFSRALSGIGLGLMSAVVPSYVSECSPRAIRGRCVGAIEVAVGLGNMMAFWINYRVSFYFSPGQLQWRLPLIVQAIPGVLFLFLMLFQPESPRWLAERSRYSEAAAALAYIARKDVNDDAVVVTLSEIRADYIAKHNLSLLAQFRKMGESKTIALRCVIPSIATFFQQWSGTNAINNHMSQIFASFGFIVTRQTLFASSLYIIFKFAVSCATLVFIIESWGRKRALIYGGLVQALTMFFIGGYAAAHPNQGAAVPPTYASLIAVYLYGVFFCLGWGVAPQVLGAEVAPGHLRAVVMSLASATTWLFTYVVSEITPTMLERITYGTYLVFGVACLVMVTWAYACVPETAGCPLEDIKYLFERDNVIRSLEDAPCGWIFLGKRRAIAINDLKAVNALPMYGPQISEIRQYSEQFCAQDCSRTNSPSPQWEDPLII